MSIGVALAVAAAAILATGVRNLRILDCRHAALPNRGVALVASLILITGGVLLVA